MIAAADDSAEFETWGPHGLSDHIQDAYPYIQSHAASTFTWTCKLVEIIHQLLTEVYNPLKHGTHDHVSSCLMSQRGYLAAWWKILPDYLRLVPEALPEYSPPNHIVTLKYVLALSSMDKG